MGVAKARSGTLTILMLAVLAGAFISLGALFFAFVITKPELGFGPARLLGGLCFSLGLILVIVGGAELFTGNNLLAMAWASKVITTGDLVRNWVVVYLGNVVGVLGTMFLCFFGGIHELAGESVGARMSAIGAAKAALPWQNALPLAVLCNGLVCLAVWLSLGARSVGDKVLAIVFPITAFVACGFEHSIANWFFLAYAAVLDPAEGFFAAAAGNLAVVTVGNILGGSLLVSAVYWAAYLRGARN